MPFECSTNVPGEYSAGQRWPILHDVSTSAAGSIRIEILDDNEKAIDGYSLEDCDEFFGDTVNHIVTWKDSSDVSRLEGQPVRLRFVLHDADVYSFRFK